ncbi:hypothetical protein CAOG_08353 [Capsaspora owczarzaki ATCC 30864]|uniref:hypothetical protein n=1 Tax=Capsaspora owczarzaki (strain ATCC 30864) TaxID=595528 RepID=UPI0001FE308C|nr:hypothetical protein CAOG_08353 [Capsaspora owczarzaki ATCC 30864]|eukprot:XP_004340833.1 hypothetical protein CAOG_08353 [Capsaspora owczarzaki ATCC 30864]
MADAAENSVLFVSIIAIYASLGFFIVFIWAYRQRKRLASRQRAPQRCMPLAWGDLTSFENQFVIAALQETAATKIEPQPHHASRNPGWRLVADDQGNMIEQNYQQDMARALDSLAEIAAHTTRLDETSRRSCEIFAGALPTCAAAGEPFWCCASH